MYSAGIVLFEALTGVAPYTGDNAISVAYRHVNDDVPAPSTLVHRHPAGAGRAGGPRHQAGPGGAARGRRRVPRRAGEAAGAARRAARAGVPVPAPTVADRTIPVSPAERAAAIAQPAHERPRRADLAESPAEQTVTNATAGARRGMPGAPTPRSCGRRRAGFRPIGPQGTRAMLRTDLDRANAATEFVPPAPAPRPAAAGTAAARPAAPAAQAAATRQEPSRASQIVLWSIVGVLVLALVGTTHLVVHLRPVPHGAERGRQGAARRPRGPSPTATSSRSIEQQHDNTVPAGTVIGTDPAKGRRCCAATPVKMVVSKGRPKVPDIQAGAERRKRESSIRDAGAASRTATTAEDRYSDDVAKGKVVEIKPQPGTELDIGKRVVIVLSKGPRAQAGAGRAQQDPRRGVPELQDDGFTPKEGPAEFSPTSRAAGSSAPTRKPGQEDRGRRPDGHRDPVQRRHRARPARPVGRARPRTIAARGSGCRSRFAVVRRRSDGTVACSSSRPHRHSRVEPNSKVTLYAVLADLHERVNNSGFACA